MLDGCWAAQTVPELDARVQTALGIKVPGGGFIVASYSRQNTYSGRRDGWIFTPPYLAAWSKRRGMKSPKDTATMRLMGLPPGLGSYFCTAKVNELAQGSSRRGVMINGGITSNDFLKESTS
jgi:hypothetical protein